MTDMAWQWTQPRQIAAQMVAEGKKLTEIASATNTKPATIGNWKKQPEFAERVEEISTEMAEALKRAGLRVKEYRIDRLNDLLNRMYQVIEGRAEDMQDIAGGESGLLVRKKKSIGWGENTEKVTEYAFDRALVEELREVLKHAAQEVGEWTEKRELTGPDGSLPTLNVIINGLPSASAPGDGVPQSGQ